MEKVFQIAGMSILLFFLGCSSKLPVYKETSVERTAISSAKEKKLARAFLEYWRARIQRDYKTSYQYELPYQKYIFRYPDYLKKIGNIYSRSKIKLSKITYIAPDIAIVDREVKMGNKVFHKKDKWIYIDGAWYHKFYQTILPSLEEAEYQ